MKTNTRQRTPLLITALAVLLVSFLYMVGEETKDRPEGQFRVDIFDRLESITYDARVRMAAANVSSNDITSSLGTMFIEDDAIELVNDGAYSGYMAPAWDDGNTTGLNFSVPWPRFMYGQVVRELKAQGVKAIAFDILFSELDVTSTESSIAVDETNVLTSDEFFGQQIAAASNVVLATEGELLPQEIFAEGALSIASIASQNDYAVLRRVRAFGEYKVWNPKIVQLAKALGLRMRKADLNTPGFVKIPYRQTLDDPSRAPFKIPLLRNGNLMLTKDGDINVDADEKDLGPDNEPPYTVKRAWNLGISLAAIELGVDLNKAIIEQNRIILTAVDGTKRIIPTDADHRFFIDWSLRFEDIKSHRTPVKYGFPLNELSHDFGRHRGTNVWENEFTNRLVIVGSVATGNNLTDTGATPLEEKTPLVTKHLNVANSVITGRFVTKTSNMATIGLVMFLGLLSGWITWRAKVLNASIAIAVVSIIYVVGAFLIFVQSRYWLPIIMPVFGGLLLPHFALVTYRVVFEQREQRHIKSTFQRLVAPEIVDEILASENLDLGGERRDITVYFADVRGFTEFTDRAHAEGLAYIEKKKLSPEDAEIFLNKQAQETMSTVNLYLGTISRQIKKHRGTLDKYIGDCVMAFWGAPIGEEQHALLAVRAAVDSQRAMFAVNQDRHKENEARKKENTEREARGEDPLTMLPLLTLGSGINSGHCVVGMMGSAEHVSSYTVFGREVNLASRLEGVSGRGRIIVSYRTYLDCKKFDPELASTFVELEAVKVKGISEAVRIFEVPWKLAEDTGGTVLMTASAVPVKAQQPETTTQSKSAS